jgi:chitodextrinase
MWEHLTPFRDGIYTYEQFLTAISTFPAFCGERGTHGHAATLTADQVCQKELATLFAHFAKETGYNWADSIVPAGYPGEGQLVSEAWRQAFYWIREVKCDPTGSNCDYYSSDWGNDVNYPRPDSST